MATRYVTRKTSRLYKLPTGGERKMVLIYGDEVETTGNPVNNRVPVLFRGKDGFIPESQLGEHPVLELYFIDVGQGDSTFMVTPARKKILIDGGLNSRALGFLAWKYQFDEPGTDIDIDLLMLSHADGDHLNGLVPIVQHPRINVRQVLHSGIATYQPGAFDTRLGNLDPSENFLLTLHDSLDDLAGADLSQDFADWRDILITKATPYQAVDTTSGTINVGDLDITIEVIGPKLDVFNGQRVFSWFSNVSHTINGHSIVLRLTCGSVSVVFSGDLNIEGAKHLLANANLASMFGAHVFKAPHHGSHEFYRPLLDAIRPQISIISSGDEPDHGHPRANFIGAVGQASRSVNPIVFSTEIAATFEEVGQSDSPNEAINLAELNFITIEANALARNLFKRRLHGMINVRTDGQELFAARRVAAGYWWEAYGPENPAP